MNILISGGAGFIGVHLARRLIQEGCSVTILDNFNRQVHGEQRNLPRDIADKVALIVGDVRERDVWRTTLTGQDIVVHLAAETGTGQSMYEIKRYEEVNIGGTALLFDCLMNDNNRTIKKIVLASSRAIYGEGKYQCAEHDVVYPQARTEKNMLQGLFEPVCPICGLDCKPLPTDEHSQQSPSSMYGLTKLFQEQITLLFAKSMGISAFTLRYQNVYGPGQSLRNPYTGILAIFSNLARSNEPINIFEDGKESRDFVFIQDVVEATWRCLNPKVNGVEAINIGSGVGTSVNEVIKHIIGYFNSNSPVRVSGSFRLGDIRHNFADITKARQILGFEPQWDFRQGINRFLEWVDSNPEYVSAYEQSLKEMREKGLLKG